MCDEPDFRFPDDAAKAIDKNLGVYGGGLTPGVNLKTTTGLPRGTELFHRPELHRPWRSASAQHHAEMLVSKEQEVEVLTRKNDELRSQLAVVTSNLHKVLMTSKDDIANQVAKKEIEIDELIAKVREAEDKLRVSEKENDQRLNQIRTQHLAEVSELNKNIRASHDTMKDMSDKFSKQIEDMKDAAKKDLEQMELSYHIRVEELLSETTSLKEESRKVADRASENFDDVRAEVQRNEQRLMEQHKQEGSRFVLFRSSMEDEKHKIEAQMNKAIVDLSAVTARYNAVSNELAETETRCRDWNSRLLSDLEKLNVYYANAIKDIDGIPTIPTPDSNTSMIYNVYVPPRLVDDVSYRTTMESIARSILQLTWMKEYHYSSTQDLKRVKKTESFASETGHGEKDINRGDICMTPQDVHSHYNSLVSQIQDVKTHQKRLQSAMIELKDIFSDTEALLSSSISRINFFNNDLQKSIECPTNCVVAPRGVVSFVALCVEGSRALWEEYPSLFGDCLAMLNQCIRGKLAQYGGYECFADGDCLMAAFQDPVWATKFAFEVHTWAMSIAWPKYLLKNPYASEELDENGRVVRRGLRLQTGLHLGEVGFTENSAIPVGVGKSRAHYFGKVITQTLNVADIALGGQVIASSDLWNIVKSPHQVGSPQISNLGNHNIGDYGVDYNQVLYMLTPATLKEHVYHPKSRSGVRDSKSISTTFDKIRHSSVAAEVEYLKQKHDQLTTSIMAIDNETRAVSTFIKSVDNKVRDARLKSKRYTQEDAVAQATVIDRISSISDLILDEIKRAENSQEEIGVWVRNLENALTNFTRVMINNGDLKRKILAVQEMANEKLHDQSLRNGSKSPRLGNLIARSDDQCNALRTQLHLSHLSTPVNPMITNRSSPVSASRMNSPGRKLMYLPKSCSQSSNRSKSGNWR